MLNGRYQEGQLGFQLSVPLGFRQGMAQVRNNQLLLARARAALEDMELEVSHLLSDAVAELESEYEIAQTQLNRRVAAGREVDAMEAAYDTGTVTLDRLLDAQRRRADAEVEYYRTVVNYNNAIKFVHFRKGSLLDYNNVVLAEGPWPNKAYYDAHQRARRRDASYIMDYGFTRPRVASKGPMPQLTGTAAVQTEEVVEGVGEGDVMFEGEFEPIPLGEPTTPAEETTPPAEATPSEGIDEPVQQLPIEPYIPSPLESLEDNPTPGGAAPSRSERPQLFEPTPPASNRAEPGTIETRRMPRRSTSARFRQPASKAASSATTESAVQQATHIEFVTEDEPKSSPRVSTAAAGKAKKEFKILDPASGEGAHVEVRFK